jgi:DNA-binding CsgD family transcriptional regulator
LDELSKLILELYRTAKETPVDEFQELALALVRAQTNFRTAVWGSGEMTSSGLIAHSVHLHNEPMEMLTEWTAINHKDTLIDEVIACSGQSLISHAPNRFGHSDQGVVLDYVQRFGHLNNMTITTVSQSEPAGQWLSLYRSGKHDYFGQDDKRILEQMMPHLVEALEINRMLAGVGNAGFGLKEGVRAVARMDGTLYHCGVQFAAQLSDIWPAWKGGRLPAQFMSALQSGRDTIFTEHAIAVSATSLGNLLLLKIRKISPLNRLSPREIVVAKLYVQGQTYKEIGISMEISPVTVRNFLARIYTKLAIGNKLELAAMLSKT